ncbi:MAG: cache domain-containing protein [Methanospirillum sp.]
MARRIILLIAFIAVMALVAGCIQSPPANATTPATTAAVTTASETPPAAITTTPDLIAFVKRAASFARENGRVTAVAAFNNPNGSFVVGNVHIFAVDYNRTLLADPTEPATVGTDISNLTDSFGIPLVKKLGETARFGRGLVSYDYPNPKNNAIAEPKLTVVEDVDGAYYVAAGFYASEGDVFPSVVLNTTAAKANVSDLVAYVKSAVAYARTNGKEKALAAFNDPNGGFVRGELVIMALDSNGTALASPPYAPEVAANRINLVNYNDPDGVGTIRGMRDLVRSGGGFFYTVAKVTVNGTSVLVPKINYAEPVDGSWWLFSGVVDPAYIRVAARNLTGIPVRQHSRSELYDLVSRAVDVAKTNGSTQALAAIDDPNGPFVRGDLFVWAEGTNGTVLADPFWKEGIGKNYLDFSDTNGMKTTRVGIDTMQNGTGFSHALFQDTSANGTALVPKLVYTKAVDDAWWIGGGIYGVEVKG